MKEMLNDDRSNQALQLLIIGVVILALLGAFLVFFNNPKYVMFGIIDKVNNSLITSAQSKTGYAGIFDDGYVTNMDIEYLINTTQTIYEDNIIIDEETGEQTTGEPIEKIVPITIQNKLKAKLNKNSDNAYDVITLTYPTEAQEQQKDANSETTEVEAQQPATENTLLDALITGTKPETEVVTENQDVIYNIYHQRGSFVLDAPLYGKFIKLNSQPIATDVIGEEVLNDYITMYARFTKEMKKQFKWSDFYRLKDKQIVGENSQTLTKYGIALTEERFNEIVIKTLQSLRRDEAFITALANVEAAANFNATPSKNSAKDKVDNYIQELEQKTFEEEKKLDIIITTSGLFNDKIEKIEFLYLNEEDIILYSGSATMSMGKLSNIQIANDTTSILNVAISPKEGGYTMIASNPSVNLPYNLTIDVNNYAGDAGMDINAGGTIFGKQLGLKFTIRQNEKRTELENTIEFSLMNGLEKEIYLKVSDNTKKVREEAYAETKTMYSPEDLDEQALKFYADFKTKLLGNISQ